MSAHLSKAGPSQTSEPVGSLPAVVILNLSYSGLGIARDMAGHGVHVVGLSSDRKIYGNFTRACEVWFAPDAKREPEKLADFLLSSVSALGGAVVFPTSDFDVLFLDRFRTSLEPHYRLSIAARDSLLRIMNKQALFLAAVSAGVAAPKTVTVTDAEQLAHAGKEIGFPCVVKPISSIHWRPKEDCRTAHNAKAVRARNLDELNNEYANASKLYPGVLLQEWVAGDADKLAVLGGYADESSELLAYFTAKKIIQTPDEFGTGCLVESVELPALLEPTRRLLRSLRYRGMAEVEYKFDSTTGQYKLIEINPRHWDWHRLGSASGVNLTWTAYCHLVGRPIDRAPLRTAPAKWIAEDTLAYYCFQRALHREIDARKLFKGLSGQRIYGIFAWGDPAPFLHYSVAVGLPRLGKKIVAELRHRMDFFSALATSMFFLPGASRLIS